MARIPDNEVGRLVLGFGVELKRLGVEPIASPRLSAATSPSHNGPKLYRKYAFKTKPKRRSQAIEINVSLGF